MKFYFDFISPYAYLAWTFLRGSDPVPPDLVLQWENTAAPARRRAVE